MQWILTCTPHHAISTAREKIPEILKVKSQKLKQVCPKRPRRYESEAETQHKQIQIGNGKDCKWEKDETGWYKLYNNFHMFACNNYTRLISKIVFCMKTRFLVGGNLRFKVIFHSGEYSTQRFLHIMMTPIMVLYIMGFFELSL
jgi:hypothetical protein